MRQTCLKTIYEISKKDKKILFVGSDLGPGVMENFKKKFHQIKQSPLYKKRFLFCFTIQV